MYLTSNTANRKDIDIIRRRVCMILQNQIDSNIASNKNVKDLINIFNQIQTDDKFQLKFVNDCIFL